MNPELLTTLQNVGLTSKESRAYAALLKLGRGSAASVARVADLKPPTAYVVLNKLINKGFAQRLPRTRKSLFVPEPPTAALAAVEARADDFRSALPSLLALEKLSSGNKPRTLFFEGESGMRKCYAYRMDELRDLEYVAFFASAEDVGEESKQAVVRWNKEMVRRNISSRAIVPEHPSLKSWRQSDAEFRRQVKIVPAEVYSSKNSIEIFPDFVRILMFKNLQGIIIGDKETASSLRQIFEMVWKSL